MLADGMLSFQDWRDSRATSNDVLATGDFDDRVTRKRGPVEAAVCLRIKHASTNSESTSPADENVTVQPKNLPASCSRGVKEALVSPDTSEKGDPSVAAVAHWYPVTVSPSNVIDKPCGTPTLGFGTT
jgi:hypothetical protein